MKDFIRNIANLVKVKTIVTFLIMIVYAVLALKGIINPDKVDTLATTVVAFYFGTQHEKGGKE